MTTPLLLGILFLVGLAADLVGRSTFLPRVTLLLLGGAVAGPAGLALLSQGYVDDWFPTLTGIALGLIGFLLGNQLSAATLRQRGKRIVTITVCKVFGAWFVVSLCLLLVGVDPVIALLLAGVAPATAPAATYDLVHESGAKGEFVDTLLSVVALDDVIGLMLFVLMMAVAGILSGDAEIGSSIVASSIQIGGSIALGVGLGAPMAYLTGRIRRGEPMLAEALGFILLAAGIAEQLGLLPILSAMVMGMTVASLARHHDRPFHAVEGIEWPFMILFFVLAGASFQVDALIVAGIPVIVYIAARFVGIYMGVRFAGSLVQAPAAVRNWLGIALMPQAGVAIGMALLATQRFPETANIILTVVVSATVVLETVGPVLTRKAIRAANGT
jgi:Kef-type K+ transport system membrane component KefB